jgi:hypothetical protein
MGRESKEHLIHCGRVITACSGLSRSELALTIGEHLEWRSATGSLKLDACVRLLEKLEGQGVLKLPAKQVSSGGARKPPPLTERTAAGEPLEGSVGELVVRSANNV